MIQGTFESERQDVSGAEASKLCTQSITESSEFYLTHTHTHTQPSILDYPSKQQAETP